MANIRVLNNLSIYNSITAISGITSNALSIGGQPLNGYSLAVGGDTYVSGNLNVAGSAIFHNTEYTTTSSISVTNTGTGPALVVNQTGEEAIAAFYDDSSIAFYIDGKTGTGGYVGIGTNTPNEKLTVVGVISSTDLVYTTGIGSGSYVWYFQTNGSIYFPYAPSNNRTGSGNNLIFDRGSGYQKIISTQNGTETDNTVERLVVAGGDSYNNSGTYQGEGGDIYLWAGYGQNGGDIKVDAGNGQESGGTIKVRSGYGENGNGGFLELNAGDSGNNGDGGTVTINAGDAAGGSGGSVNINAGCGSLGNGNITLQTCEGGTHQLILSSTGQLITPYNLVVNGSISASGGILGGGGGSTIQKVISTFGNTTDTLYEIDHNLQTEDVVVSIIDTGTKEVVYPSVVNYSLSSIKVEFAVAPGTNAYKAIIIG